MSTEVKKCKVCSRFATYASVITSGKTLYVCGYHKHHKLKEIVNLFELNQKKSYYTPSKKKYYQSDRGKASRKRYQSSDRFLEIMRKYKRNRYQTDEEFREQKKRESREYYASKIKPLLEQQQPEERVQRSKDITDQYVANLQTKEPTGEFRMIERFRRLKGPTPNKDTE